MLLVCWVEFYPNGTGIRRRRVINAAIFVKWKRRRLTLFIVNNFSSLSSSVLPSKRFLTYLASK